MFSRVHDTVAGRLVRSRRFSDGTATYELRKPRLYEMLQGKGRSNDRAQSTRKKSCAAEQTYVRVIYDTCLSVHICIDKPHYC